MINFAQNTNFDIFPQKLNMKAHFPNFSDFLHVWCVFNNIWKLVILKVILCLGYSKVGVMNSHLKSGENWPKHKFWYFLSKTIYESTFSPFFIFLHIRVVSQNTLCMSIEITVFFLSAQIFQNWKIHDAVFSWVLGEIMVWHRFWSRIWTPRVEITIYGNFELFI